MITSEINRSWPIGHEKRTLTVYDGGRRYTVFSGSGLKIKEWTQAGVSPLTAEEIQEGLRAEGARIVEWQQKRAAAMAEALAFARLRYPAAEIKRGWRNKCIYSPEEVVSSKFEGIVTQFDIENADGLSVDLINGEFEWIRWLDWRGL